MNESFGRAGTVAGEHGHDPADYDAEWLAEAWALLTSGAEVSGPHRALFDLGLSVAARRAASSSQSHSVDPSALDSVVLSRIPEEG